MPHRVLICDDEADIRESLRALLLDEGYEASAVASGANAVAEAPDFDVLLLDIKMPGQDGMEALTQIRSRGIATPVVMISGHGDVRTAVEALSAGATDFLEKPLSSEHVLNAIRKALDKTRLARENEELRRRLGLTRLVGTSPAMKALLADIARAAPTPATVLVQGPSGTGKELVARSLHEGSLVRGGPFIQVNCAAIPDTLIESELFGHERGSFTGADRKQTGKFVEADGGTIFLDEVGDMSLSAQAKVLRVLQEGEVEPVGSARVVKVKVRVVAATNRELENLIREGRFREDLYYRLAVLILKTPALSEHAEDIPLLVLHFADHFARTNNYRPKKLTEGALRVLAERSWPGNVRELKNFVERLMIMVDGDVVDARALDRLVPSAGTGAPAVGDDRIATLAAYAGVAETVGGAPAAVPAPREGESVDETWARLAAASTLSQFQDEAERLFLLRKLAENGWNVTKTAEAIDTPRSNLYKKIDRYGLKRDRTDEERRAEGVEA